MHRAAIRELAKDFLERKISEDHFWYHCVKHSIQGGYQITFIVAQCLALGLTPEGGDGS